MPHRTPRPITYNGVYYPTMQEAAAALEINYRTLSSRLNSYNYTYQKSLKKVNYKYKPVEQIDLKSGKVIARFSSATEAGESLGKGTSGILRVCNKKKYAHSGYGFGWRFAKS